MPINAQGKINSEVLTSIKGIRTWGEEDSCILPYNQAESPGFSDPRA